jgi:hypothetical protein
LTRVLILIFFGGKGVCAVGIVIGKRNGGEDEMSETVRAGGLWAYRERLHKALKANDRLWCIGWGWTLKP